MSDVSGVGVRRHFSSEEEEALRRDESTNSIVKRDGKTSADISGADPTWRQTKEHQQSIWDNKMGGLEIAHAALEGLEFAGVIHGAATTIGLPIAGFALGAYGLHEAHEKGHEQSASLAKDDAHVALIGALDLPPSFKAARIEGAFRHVERRDSSPATRMTAALLGNRKDLAVLQLHADRGMNAARDMARSNLTIHAFLKSNPKLEANYRQDAAFREGFDGYLHARSTLPPKELEKLDAKLDERDAWYGQSQINFRG